MTEKAEAPASQKGAAVALQGRRRKQTPHSVDEEP